MIEAKVNGTVPTRDSASNNGSTSDATAFALSNLAFAEELYFQFLRDPGSVEPAWRAYFQGLEGANGTARSPAASIPPAAFSRSIFAVAPAPKIAEGNPTATRTSVRLLSQRVHRLVQAYPQLGPLSA